jgi:hypothetical protein
MAAAAKRIYAAPVVMDCFIASQHSDKRGAGAWPQHRARLAQVHHCTTYNASSLFRDEPGRNVASTEGQ